ncbi:hypothetical protein K491DRAFT_589055 [Lophiostoma macrostomum CBS 122681]|uniref:F-box domain-containing protein n=1 Tax=Lophiostoma macrostomum CBS 122681 TaxID=1314788 RepID=A0A6A6TPD4_9PLEO|nr:hypothetical protein K491DRAFT_589055 [Lophiostoma macrostomum CBS 122681]
MQFPGPPCAHFILKDVACCCNIAKIHEFYTSMMALRRNPQRRCRKEELSPKSEMSRGPNIVFTTATVRLRSSQLCPRMNELSIPRRRSTLRRQPSPRSAGPFRFFDLPREVRDNVYSYLVVRRGRRVPIIEAKSIIRAQKKRATAQKHRERHNQRRILSGRPPIVPREPVTDSIVHLNILQTSQCLRWEARDHFYHNNWFAISLDAFPITTMDVPESWDLGRITKMQLELQLKDAQRMNTYVDWTTFFNQFSALRHLRIIPTFHQRYYDWAQSEISTWDESHFVFRAFFRELLVSVPEHLNLKLGPALDSQDVMTLEGRGHVSRDFLRQMYTETGTRRDMNGNYIGVKRIVDCRDLTETGYASLLAA